ncbi:MAG: 30S ribosomal protein S17 [Promethearchaeota archaeon]
MTSTHNIGIPGVVEPTNICEDPNCPFHGKLSLRGRILLGKVVSTKMRGTIVIQRDFDYYVPKYQRYERRRSKIKAHLPSCIEVSEGDMVRVSQCRKLAKTVDFVVVEKISKEEK